MRYFCSSCKKETEQTRIRKNENFNLDGISIDIVTEPFECTECKNINVPAGSPDVNTLVEQEYKARTGQEYIPKKK